MAGADQLQVWCARTDVVVDERVLSRDERARADRFRFPHHRLRWVAARVLLRSVLAEGLDCAPQDVRFRYSEYGKPLLDDDRVRFNLSHSGDIAVCVVCQSREVGIDVEQVREVPGMDGVFRSIASEAELRAWRGIDLRERQEAFFRCWTVKESCVKALGTGLTRPVQDIEVLTTAEEPCIVESAARTWRVFTFVPSAGYVAALSVEVDARHSGSNPAATTFHLAAFHWDSGPALGNASRVSTAHGRERVAVRSAGFESLPDVDRPSRPEVLAELRREGGARQLVDG